ncbi:MAG: protein translocase subunit SecY [Planctomycetota bacterium]|nr:MAG: protein translocase subunit SecY [Planctomycetota bacterium]
MNILRAFLNVLKIPELRNKLLFTVGLLMLYRVGFVIPVPGVDQQAMSAGMGALGGLAEYFQLFTGGNLSQSTIFGLGIMPYISASIIFQLLMQFVPALEKLSKEGQSGMRKINEYQRYATVALCLFQALLWMRYLASQNFIYPAFQGMFFGMSFTYMLMSIVALTSGTMLLMWLGEQIDEYGIGNGISLIIMAGIVSRMPTALAFVWNNATPQIGGADDTKMDPLKILFLVVAFVAVVAGSILITQGQRRIPIQQAKQTRGRRVFGGQRQYLPLRVNHGGVMPIIFASTLLIFPSMLFSGLAQATGWGVFASLANWFGGSEFPYIVTYVALVYFFAYFWTSVQFRPKDMANNLRDGGSFIPGLRPGKRTADYLDKVMARITYVGAGFLALIALIPTIIAAQLKVPFLVSAFLGGTGLLIVVSVALDLVQRIEANLIMRNYPGFLGGAGAIRGERDT